MNYFMKKFKVATAGFVAAIMLLASMSTPAFAGYYSDTAEDHSDVPLSEIRATEIYDYDTVKASINALVAALDKADNDAEVQKLYDEMLGQIDDMVTANSLINLEFYTHLEDESISDRMEKMSEELVELGDMANSAISKMVDGAYRYIVENDIGDGAKDFENYVEMTDEEKELYNKETSLETDYERYSSDATLTDTARYARLAKIYINLVKVRKNMIELSDDYDSYRDYAYESIYGRDYTAEMADQYHEYVKKYVVPLYNQVVNKIIADYDTYEALWDADCGDLDDIFAIMDKHLGEIDPELMVSYNYFRKNNMFYIENDENMYEAGYTTKFYTYNTPFIYNALYDSFYDYTDVFHEFGHFNNMFHETGCAMYSETSYDVAEIHSQTMELFFLEWAEECYGENLAEMARLFTLYRMFDSVISGSLYDEFQAKVFEMDASGLVVGDLTILFGDLLKEYGRDGADETQWVDVSHTFTSPFYYISYSTSAMAALQIYQMSQVDRAGAIDLYMQLTALPGSIGFCEAVEGVGLQNIMADGVVEKVCNGLVNTSFGNKTEPTPEPTAEPTPEPTAEPTVAPTAEPTVEVTPEPTQGGADEKDGAGAYNTVRNVAIFLCCIGIVLCVIARIRKNKQNPENNNTNGNE